MYIFLLLVRLCCEGGGHFISPIRVAETSSLQNVYVKHRPYWHTLQKACDKQDSGHTAEPILTVGVTVQIRGPT